MQMLRFAKFQMVMHKKKTIISFIPCGMLNNHSECSPEHDGSNRNGTKSFQNGISNLLKLFYGCVEDHLIEFSQLVT